MQESLRRFKADIFQAMAHPTRVAIMEMLKVEELSAGTLMERLGKEQANVSQHLAVLRAKHLVNTRRSGNQIFYSIHTPLIADILDIMRNYFHAHLKESLELLGEMESADTEQNHLHVS